MKYLKAIGYIAAAEVLSLFVGLTLASSSSTFIRTISAVCTSGILICLMINFAVNTARADLKKERISGNGTNHAVTVTVGITASLPAVISWIVLYISHSSGSFDFYRWHKLLNAYFLQIYNFINPDASTAALSGNQVMVMLSFAAVPCLTFITAYFLVYKGIIRPAEK